MGSGTRISQKLLKLLIRAVNLVFFLFAYLAALIILSGGGWHLTNELDQLRRMPLPDAEIYFLVLCGELLVAGGTAAIIILILSRSRRFAYSVLRVDSPALANFAMLFTGLLAFDIHHFVPPYSHGSIPVHHPFFELQFLLHMLPFIVFFAGWPRLKAILLRVVEIDPASSEPPEIFSKTIHPV